MSTLNWTDMTNPSNITESETQFLLGVFLMHNVAVWVHLVIMIVGLITNPLILIVLSKKPIGSKSIQRFWPVPTFEALEERCTVTESGPYAQLYLLGPHLCLRRHTTTVCNDVKEKRFVVFTGEASRIVLRFLAVADMGCLLTNFFFSVVPAATNPNWFVVSLNLIQSYDFYLFIPM